MSIDQLISQIATQSIVSAILLAVLWWFFTIKQRNDEQLLAYVITIIKALAKLEILLWQIVSEHALTPEEKREIAHRLQGMIEELTRNGRT